MKNIGGFMVLCLEFIVAGNPPEHYVDVQYRHNNWMSGSEVIMCHHCSVHAWRYTHTYTYIKELYTFTGYLD